MEFGFNENTQFTSILQYHIFDKGTTQTCPVPHQQRNQRGKERKATMIQRDTKIAKGKTGRQIQRGQ